MFAECNKGRWAFFLARYVTELEADGTRFTAWCFRFSSSALTILMHFSSGQVTPVLAMLRDIIARRAHHATTGSYGTEGAPPERVYFVFAARTQAELDLVAPTLAAALE